MDLKERIEQLEKLIQELGTNIKKREQGDIEVGLFNTKDYGLWISWFRSEDMTYVVEPGMNTKDSYKSSLFMLLSHILPDETIKKGSTLTIKIDSKKELDRLFNKHSELSETMINLTQGLMTTHSCKVEKKLMNQEEADRVREMAKKCSTSVE